MSLDKKKNSSKFSLREVFSPNQKSSSPPADETSPSSHRFLLKKKDSKSSMISPQTSSSSLGSLLRGRNHSKSAEALNPAASVSHHQDTTTDSVPGSLDVTPYTSNERVSGKLDDHSVPVKVAEDKSHHHHHHHHHNNTNAHKAPKLTSNNHGHNSHSHLSLKRFLKKFKHSPTSDHHQHPHQNNSSTASIASSLHAPHFFHTSSSSSISSSEMFKKYGNIGKLLGTGASGSVSLLTSESDPSKIYAVKKFRAKLPNESESDYRVKVKNEFKIGEILIHQNLIHTYELIKETSSKFLSDTEYFIVMEYCPYDFFNLVMSGLMDRKEIACYFKQIINGVAYLHENGLAHRDLKLDNCVVNSNGILKLIDFGSAVHFKREKVVSNPNSSEDDLDEKYRLIRARGIVGSDPYLAPEVFEPSNFGYDPRLVDIWSIAIIYCCMILKRFPWKLPRESDPSYKAFAGIDDEVQEKPKSNGVSKLEKEMKGLSVDNSEASSIQASEKSASSKIDAVPRHLIPEIDSTNVSNSATPVTTSTREATQTPSPTTTPTPTPAPEATKETAQTSAGDGLPPQAPAQTSTQKKLPPRGPERLLRILPSQARPLIRGMLTIDTSKRFLIEDIIKDDFYKVIELCTQDPTTNDYVPAEDHTHHLVTEEELQKINEEKEKMKHLKDAGMA
ncbi:serine/threonine-protein kinase Hrk1p [[Candida] railenensis]|uniref:non-specific serine/threonine protein kinase n=1 Tax=[Candida] railenensis TaxID=45579 RepID=A0A9P0QMY5_9ASCO|nr:serine/threonine-protein kinase Hrk1p [[Candida] railenensis]